MTLLTAPYLLTGAISNQETAYWDNVTFQSGTVLTAIDPGNLKLSTCSFTFRRTVPSGFSEDAAVFTLHLCNDPGTGGAINALDATMAAAAETIFDTLITTLKVDWAAHWVHTGYVWRSLAADGPRGAGGTVKPTPAWRVTSRNVAGTNASVPLPDQICETVTFRTPSRRHWGRVYLPSFVGSVVTNEGHITQSGVDLAAGAFHTAIASLLANTSPLTIVVWNGKNPGALPVWQLSVDDVYDVQRRRRAKQATYHKIYTS